MKPHFSSTQRVVPGYSLLSFLICFCLALTGTTAVGQVEFSVNSDNGCAPLTVNATNLSHTYWDTTNATFYWFDVSSNPQPTDSTYNFSYMYTVPGSYEMRLQGYDSFMVYMGEWNRMITVGGAAPFMPVDSSSFCPGSSINFSYNSFYNTLEWDYGDGSPSEMWNWTAHTYADTGTYTVRLVVNDNCGNDTIYQTIFIDSTAVPVPNPSANVWNVCVGDQVSFNAGGLQSSYDWRFDDGDSSIQENPFHSYTDTGNYTIMLTVTNICGQQAIDSLSLRVDTGLFPNAWFGSSPGGCPNQLIGFNAQDPGSYAWDFGNGMTDTVQNPDTYFADTGTYTVRLILTNGCGNVDTNIQSITISYDSIGNPGSAQIEFLRNNMWQVDTDTVCVGDPVPFRNDSWSGTQVTYKWLYGDGDSSLLQDPPAHAYTTAATYEVQLIRSTGCGGVDTARKWVVVQAAASPNADMQLMPMNACPGEAVLFFDFDVDDDVGYIYTYNIWYGDGDSSGTLPDSNDLEFVLDTHTYASVGNYEVIFTVTNGCGVTDTVTDTVFVNNPNTMPFYMYDNSSSDNGSACPGDTVEFWVASLNDIGWDYGDGSPIDSTGDHVYASPGTYYVTGYMENGCGTIDTILDTAVVNMNNMIGGQAGVNDNFGCIGDTLWFSRQNWGGGGDGPQNEQHLWYFGDGDSATTENAYHVYSAGGVYMVSYSITNGCGSTMSGLTVIIDEPNIDESELTITDASCGIPDGSVTGLNIFSPGQFTFLWENASQIPVGTDTNLLSQPAGAYTLTIANQNGCTSTSGPHAIINTGAPLAPIALSPADYCNGDPIADLTASGTGGTLIWYSNAALTDSIGTGSPFTSGATTDSTFYVTETLAGCESPATPVVITVNPEYSIVDPGIAICTGDSVVIYGVFRSAAATYYDSFLTAGNGCDSVHSTVLSLDPAATVGAGIDATVCAGQLHSLSGTMGGSASTVTWTTNGDGTFAFTNVLITDYTPGAADVVAGTVTITLTSDDPAGACPAAVDTMLLTITPAPTANAGPDQTICSDGVVTLSGSITVATGGLWTSAGDGSFANPANLATTYTPGISDIALGTISLTLTSTGNGICSAAIDAMTITMNPAATVNAGPDGANCEGPTPWPLSGTMGGSATAVIWTTTGTGTFDDDTALAANYSASFADVTAGSVNLIITTNDPDGAGPCTASTDTMILTLIALDSISVGAIICGGDSILLGGTYQTIAGSYMDGYLGTDGCDSIVTTTLVVNPTFGTPVSEIICAGDSIMLEGAYQTIAGAYIDTLTAVSGCDSVITTTLTVNPTYAMPESAAICNGDSIMLGGAYQMSAGSYVDTLTSVNGCDSVITTTLTVNPTYATAETAAICSGDSIMLGGAYRITAGTYMDTLSALNGCDSIIATALTVNPVYNMTPGTSICTGDSIFLGGAFQTTAGSYTDAYTSVDGCDSTVTTALTVVTTIVSSVNIAICDGDSVMAGGAYQSTAGAYIDSLIASGGCDSIVTTNLSVNPNAATMDSISICSGDSVMLGGSYQMTVGTYVDSFSTTAGCDSIVSTSLSIMPASGSAATASMCPGDSIMLGGAFQMTAGTYTDIYTGSNGCDSTVTTVLTIDPIPGISVSPSPGVVCAFGDTVMFTALGAATYTWSPGTGLDTTVGTIVNASPGSATTYTVTGTSSAGCIGSTTVSVQLSGGSTVAGFTSDTITCAGGSITYSNTSTNATSYAWVFSGATSIDSTLQDQVITYDSAGLYDVSLTAFGCGADSTISFTGYITVGPGVASSGSATICSADSIFIGGAFQNTAGVYTDTFISAAGCDSIVTTTLSVDLAVSAGISGLSDVCAADFAFDLATGLGGTPDGGGSWNDDDNSGALILFGNIIPALITPGTYDFTYTVTGSGACPDDSATVTLTIYSVPSAGTNGTLGACLLATSLDIATGLGGTPDSGGVWVDIDGSGALTGTIFDPSLAGLGTYNFSYSVPGNVACPPDTAIVTVSVISAANAGIDGSLTACAGDFTTQNLGDGLGGTPDGGGTWSDDDGSGGILFGDVWSPNQVQAGTYNFTYVAAAAGCPSDSAVVTMTVAAPPDAGSDGTLAVCDSNGTVDVATGLGGTPNAGGVWTDSAGTMASSVVDLSILSTGSYSFTYTVSAPPCADATATVTVNLSTCIGIGEIDNETISLYPNPSEGKFTVEFVNTADARIVVYNSTGELVAVFTSEGKPNMELDLTGNPNGLYYINVITADKVITTKVSIAR